MSKSKIITVPNPILKEKTARVGQFSDELRNQIHQMVEALHTEGGIGIAANQLGYKNQVIAIEFADLKNKDEPEHIPLTIFINPEIVEYSEDKGCFDEGCLSVPKIELEIERPTTLKLKYEDERGNRLKIAPKGLLARILQHEIDHLNGIIFTERAKENLFRKSPKLKEIKIAFFGTGEFASIILEGLIHLGLNITIYTEEAKNAGRGGNLKPSPVSLRAQKFGRKVNEISDIKTAKIANFDLLICADFGQKIPAEILRKAKIEAINLHPSLLPKFRGPSPIQTAILRGETISGVSIIKMTPEIDEGPILAQIETEIKPNDDHLSLRDKLATLGLKLLIKMLPDMVAGKIQAIPQPSGATMTHKFKKEDGEIDWKKPVEEIERQIRALHPWPRTYTFIDHKRLIIHLAHIEKDQLMLDLIQLEGKNSTDFRSFLRGWHGEKPEWFDKVKIIDKFPEIR